MADNQFIDSSLVSNLFLGKFTNSCVFLQTADRTLEKDYRQNYYKPGTSIAVRKPVRVTSGFKAYNQPVERSALIDETEVMSLSPLLRAEIAIDTLDLTFSIDELQQRYIDPAVDKLVSDVEMYVAALIPLQTSYYGGAPGQAINSYGSVDDIGVLMKEQAMDMSRNAYMALTDRQVSNLRKGALTSSQFTPMVNDDIYRHSAVGHLSYFDLYSSQNLIRQNTSVTGTITVSSTVADGANQLTVTGITGGTSFQPGDLITFPGIYRINPLNYQVKPIGAPFSVAVIAVSGTGATQTLTTEKVMWYDGPRQNMSAQIMSGQAITVLAAHDCNVAYNQSGLSLVIPPLMPLATPMSFTQTDPDYNVSIRVTQTADVNAGAAGANIFDLDLIVGARWHDDFAVRVCS